MNEQIDAYITWRKLHGSPQNTTDAYRMDLRQFRRYLLEATDVREFADVLVRHVLNYKTLLTGSYKPSSVQRKLAALRSFFSWQVENGVREDNPAGTTQGPRVVPTVREPIADSHFAAIVGAVSGEVAEDVRDRAIFELLGATGIQVSRLALLEIRDFLPTSRAVRVGPEIYQLTDTAHSALAEYTLRARPELLRGRKHHRLFVNRRGEGVTRQGIWLSLKKAAIKAGVEVISPMAIRHAVRVRQREAGAEMRLHAAS